MFDHKLVKTLRNNHNKEYWTKKSNGELPKYLQTNLLRIITQITFKMVELNSVQKFYEGKSIFVTGGEFD